MKDEPMDIQFQKHEEIHFDWAAWLTLAFALAIILLSAAQVLYRFTLPTDGWSVIFGSLSDNTWLYVDNLVGAPSPLQSLDELIAVEDLSLTHMSANSPMQPPANWVVGGHVEVTVVRQGRQLTFTIPVVGWTVAAWLRNTVSRFEVVAGWVGAFILLGVSLFTFLKRPEVPAARALLMLCTAIFANNVSSSLPDGLSASFDPIGFWAAGFFSYMIFAALLAPSLLTFTLVFPRPKRFVERHAWLALVPYALGFAALAIMIGGGPAAVGWLATMGMIIASIASLVHSGFTVRDAISRAQLRWAMGGLVVGLGLALLAFPSAFELLPDPFAELTSAGPSLGFAIIGVSLGIAILRYRLFDIDVFIRKTLVYSMLTAALALVYFGCVVLLQQVFRGLTGERSSLAIIVSTLVIAALFEPLRRRVQDVIDRRLYRRKYDAQQALAQFAQTTRDEVDLDRLKGNLIQAVEETMQPEYVWLWLNSADERRPQSVGLAGDGQRSAVGNQGRMR
jgi:hypothetical protein